MSDPWVTHEITVDFRFRVGSGGIAWSEGDTFYYDAVILKPESAAGQVRDITLRKDGSIELGPVKG